MKYVCRHCDFERTQDVGLRSGTVETVCPDCREAGLE